MSNNFVHAASNFILLMTLYDNFLFVCKRLDVSRNSRNRIAFRLEQNIEWIRETRDFEKNFRPTKTCHQTTLQSRSDVTTVNEYDEIHFKLCCLMKKWGKTKCGHQPRKTGKQGSYGTKGRNIGSFRPLPTFDPFNLVPRGLVLKISQI